MLHIAGTPLNEWRPEVLRLAAASRLAEHHISCKSEEWQRLHGIGLCEALLTDSVRSCKEVRGMAWQQ